MGKGRGGFFLKAELKRFLWYGLWDFSIIVVEKPILLQFRLQDSFFTPNNHPYTDTCSSDLPQQKIRLCCSYINTKAILVCHHGKKSIPRIRTNQILTEFIRALITEIIVVWWLNFRITQTCLQLLYFLEAQVDQTGLLCRFYFSYCPTCWLLFSVLNAVNSVVFNSYSEQWWR